MKKFAKSILCLVLALSMVLSFAACGCDKKDEKAASVDEPETEVESDVSEKNEKNEEPEVDKPEVDEPEDEATAEDTVDAFYNALFANDVEEAANYVANEDFLDAAASVFNTDAMVESLELSLGVSLSDEQKDNFVSAILGAMSYEIIDTEEIDENTVKFTVELSSPDMETAMNAGESPITEEEAMAIFEDVLADYGYTMETAESITDEELQMTITNDYMNEILSLTIDLFIEAIDDADTKLAGTAELTVVCEDGEWLISK